MGNSSFSETSNDAAEKEKWNGHLQWLDDKAAQFKNNKNKEGITLTDKKKIDDAQKKFEEYRSNPTLVTYTAAAQAHVSLVDTSVAKYENSLNDTGTYKQLFEILQDAGVAENKKFQPIMLRLIDLYHEEWDLLQETSLAMISYKTKANRIKDVIEGVQRKILRGERLTQEQINLVESSLNDWFLGEPEMVKLHDKWKAFSAKAATFKQDFTTSKIMDALKSELKKKCNKFHITLGIALQVSGIVILVGAHLITGPIATGVGVGVGALIAVGALVYYAVKAKQIRDAIGSPEQASKKMENDLNSMIKTAHGISLALGKLHQDIKTGGGVGKQQSVANWGTLYLADWDKDKKYCQEKVSKLLAEIIDSLNSFCKQCDKIKKMANDRQEQYAQF